LKECKSLAANGYDVNLIVADNLGNELKEGVNIYDVGKTNSGRFSRFTTTTRKVYKRAIEIDADIYHFHDPELMPFSYLLKLKGKKVIYDIHEDLSKQILIKNYMPSGFRVPIAKLFMIIEYFFCKKFDALVVPQPYMKTTYLKINKSTTTVENFVIKKTEKVDSNTNKEEICFHPGSLTIERGLSNMLNAFDVLDKSFKLYLAGNIEESLRKKMLDNKRRNNVLFYGQVSHAKINELFKHATLGLILYQNVGQYHLSYAIKLFEFMEKSIPVIMPNFGEWISFNEENQCGINVNPNDVNEVCEAIMRLNKNPELKKRLGRNGRLAIEKKYNWLLAEERLLKLYKEIKNDVK
jgi:glycosyltransferase involved in cell wall biosynthesis